jgi:hypothetical protein
VVGIQKRYWELLEWVCENILERDGLSFPILFDLRWGVGPK